MDKFKEAFQVYKHNMVEQNEILASLFTYKDKEEWRAFCGKNARRQKAAYDENNHFFEELDRILKEPLDDEKAAVLYDLSMELYQTELNDYLCLEKMYDVLIPYYEAKKLEEKEKLLWLYNGSYYVRNTIRFLQFATPEKRDFSSLEKLLALRTEYDQFTEENDRKRFWITYHNMIPNGLEPGIFTAARGYELFDEMMDFWNSEMVQELDGMKSSFRIYPVMTETNMINVLYTVLDEDKEIQERFCKSVLHTYTEEMKECQSIYELPGILYAGYLITGYLEKKYTLDEIFDLYMDYFIYGCTKYKNAETTTPAEIYFYLDCCDVLTRWANLGIDQDKTRKMVGSFMVIAEKRWRKLPPEMIGLLNVLLKKLCINIVKFGAYSLDAENCVKQMILSRNFYLYIHVNMVKKLSVAIGESVLTNAPELLSDFESLGKDIFLNKLSTNALFHDIGKCDLYEMIYNHNRKPTEEEKALLSTHTIKGAEFLDQFETLKQYRDVVRFHHLDYDSKEPEFQNSENKLLVDIVHIADTMTFHMDALKKSGEKQILEELTKILVAGKGSCYNPKLVSLIENDLKLKEKLNSIIFPTEMPIITEYMRNLENVSIKQDFDTYFQEVKVRFKEVTQTGRFEELNPYLDKMFEIAAESNDPGNMGAAYYLTMHFYFRQKDYLNCTNCGLEATRYLENTDNYRMLAQAYNMLGIMMQYQGNYENGLGYFLKTMEFAKRYEGGANVCCAAMNNIAGIFMDTQNYDRALYYYHSALELNAGSKNSIVCIYYNIVYCYYLIKDQANMIKYFELAKKYRKEYDYEDIGIFIHSAIVADYLGDDELAKADIENAKKALMEVEQYPFYVQEIYLFLDLLNCHERYQELANLLDSCIDYFTQETTNYEILNEMLYRRMELSIKIGDQSFLNQLSNFSSINLTKNYEKRSKIALQVEKNSRENIRTQRKQREVLQKNKKLEQEVLAAKQENAARSSFINSMSHEIRTPIHAILGLDEMIMRESHDETILQYASDIQNAGKTLIGIINDILDFSKMESGQLELNPKDYKIVDLIRELNNMIESRAKDKGLRFTIHCPENMPRTLYGDDLRIKQVVLNVLTNAVKYTKEGSVDFTLSYEKIDEQDIRLRVSVKDTGMGMKKEDLQKLSTPFARFDEDKNRNIEGTGLGMNIVNRLISQMEGVLEVFSEYGKGSEFVITLPQKVVDWTGIGDSLSNQTASKSVKKAALFTAPDAKILLVDDNAVNLKVVSSLLKRTKVQVTCVKSGRECLEIAEKEKFDVILLDHRMPELDGVETLHLLHEMRGINSTTPTIALTANAVSGAADYYKENGFEDLITKPVDYQELERKLMALLC